MFLLRIMPIYEEPLLSGQPPLLSGHLPVPRGILVPVTYCFLFPSPLTGSPEEYHQEAPSPSKPQHLLCAIPQASMQGLASLHTPQYQSTHSLPFSADRYSLATLLPVRRQPLIASILLVFRSMLTTSSTVQSMTPTLQRATLAAQAFMPLIRFPLFNFDIHSFFTRLIYSAVIVPSILVLRVWSNSKMPKNL